MIMFYANLEFVLNALFGSNLAYSTFPTHLKVRPLHLRPVHYYCLKISSP